MPVAVAALLWNLVGCAMYLHEVMLSAEDVAGMGASEQAYYAMRPAWVLGATAVAVWFGAAGCIGLILRRRWAMPLLVLSLLGLVAQDTYLFGMTGSLALPPTVYLIQGLVLLVAIGLVWMAHAGRRRNWLYARG
jgi:hypothetical protein